MRRSYALLPIAAAGLALALSAAMDASARDAGHGKGGGASTSTTSAPTAPTSKKTHKGSKRRAHRGEPLTAHEAPSSASAPARQWGDFNVVEGTLASPVEGAVCPPEMANVEGRFCIDKWEGSLVEVLTDGREVPWSPYSTLAALDPSHQLRAVSAANVFPQAYISAAQASRACAASGKRLCAPVEWRKACAGPDASTFGYGTERVSGRCNDEGRSPMLELYPQVAQSWNLVGMTEMNDPRLNQLDGTLAPTGAHSGCTNGYGVFDMVGNLHEWTNDPNGTFQGGYYLDTHKNGDGCTYRTVAHEFTYHDYSTGFRCCADVAVSFEGSAASLELPSRK
jgi:sulfatase modifying factor 1